VCLFSAVRKNVGGTGSVQAWRKIKGPKSYLKHSKAGPNGEALVNDKNLTFSG